MTESEDKKGPTIKKKESLFLNRHLVFVSVLSVFVAAVIYTTFFKVKTKVPQTKEEPKIASQAELKFKDPVSLDKDEVDQILKRNLFNLTGELGEDYDEEEARKGTEIRKTTLPLKLIGTIYTGEPQYGVAIVQNTSDQKTNSYFVGEVLTQEATVFEVYREKIIIDRGTYKEFLDLIEEQKPKPIKKKKIAPAGGPSDSFKEEGFERKGGNVVISSDYRKKLLTSDFTKVLQDAKAEPNLVGGEISGFRLTRIRPDSVYEKAGFADDDVIKEINGVALSDPTQAIKLLQKLRDEPDIDVKVERGGKEMNMNVQVK